MFSNHVTNQFSAYWNKELAPGEMRQIAEHLIGCARCQTQFEDMKSGARFAAELPTFEAPASAWPRIETALEQQARNDSRSKTPRWRYVKFAALTATAAALLSILAGLAMRTHRSEAVSSWEVARLDGSPRIGTNQISDRGRLTVGQWLETDEQSRAKIDIGNVGQVEVDPNTRIRLIATAPTDQRIELAQGRMSARISAPPRVFFVNTPSAVAEDLGCAYTLEVDGAGNSLLRVTAGWVALQLQNRQSLVPAGAACATRPGIGPGTPYFEDASEKLRAALTNVDFGPADNQSLAIIFSEARRRDAITLWYLLSRVNQEDRERVYLRLAQLAPPPAGVTRYGVLQLDRQMLDQWREAIDSDPSKLPGTVREVVGRIRRNIRSHFRHMSGK